MTFKYKAYTADKKIVEGRLDAASESIAEAMLYLSGYQRVLNLEEVTPAPSLATLIPTLFGIKTQDIIDFSQQLATLFESGLPILTALKLLEGQAAKAAMKKTISAIAEEIGNGSPFSQALGKHPQLFSNTYTQVIKASEQAGKLEIGLKQMATYMEKQLTAQQKMTRTLIYPIAVLLMSAGVVAFLIIVALPPLVSLFTSLGARLPVSTRMLIGVAGFIINYKFYLVGILAAVIAAFLVYRQQPSGKLNLDSLLLKLPVFGNISLERNLQQFCQITSILLKAGLRLPEIIELATQTISNRIIRRELTVVTDKLVQGQGLSGPMSENPLFPPLLVQMTAMGEQTGTMDSALATLAVYYEKKVDRQTAILTSLLEPVITVVIGLVVIFIALSIVTPLYSILRAI